MTSQRKSQSGLSIVEALVTMVILLIVMGGVYQIFQSNSLTYRMQQGMSRMQESGRFAMEFMLNDIRMAGYLGCVSKAPVVNNLSNSTFFAVEELTANELTIRRALDKRVEVSGISSQTNSTTTLDFDSSNTSFVADEFLVFNNCDSIRITSAVADSSNSTLEIVGGNIPDDFFTRHMGEILNIGAVTYYVGTGSSGNPALFRRVQHHTNTTQELVEGIEAIRFRYGIGNNGVEEYFDAPDMNSARWNRVRSVQIALLAVSPEEIRGMEPDTNSYVLLWDVITPPSADQRKLRRVFEASIGIRNRL